MRKILLTGTFLSSFLAFCPMGMAQDATVSPVNFAADRLQYEQNGDVLLAEGGVELSQDGRTVYADLLRYTVLEDKVEAEGNVRLVEANGDMFMADYVVLRSKLKEGAIRNLRAQLTDDSRIWAASSVKEGEKIVFDEARYTACKPCAKKPDAAPPWQIKADKVTWDRQDQTISYEDARFEVAGVPVFYTPYFRHPDGTVEQKSGLLRPEFGYQSQLGAFINQQYYHALNPSQDVTVGVIATTQENAAATLEYRQNFGNATFAVDTSATSSGRVDNVGGTEITRDDAFRGHVFADGRWDMTENWRSGFDVDLTTDEQYLRQYEFDEKVNNDDVLTSRLYAERFEDRDYVRARLMSFQDLRVEQFANDDQPLILPEIEGSWYGKAGATLGGRWSADASFLSLVRDGNGQDVTRLVGEADWERKWTAQSGVVATLNTSFRADSFITNDISPNLINPATSSQDEENRFFPRLHSVVQYPLAKPLDFGGHVLIEPVAALTLSPNLTEEDAIPNEDSVDTLLSASNLFDKDRFTGLDRIDDGTRGTYGMRTGYYGAGGNYADIFLGQSYRFNQDSNPFAAGSGLSEQASDYVGLIRTRFYDDYNLHYRFQFDGEDFESRRHEFSGGYYGDVFGINTYYFFLDNTVGTGFNDSREQVTADSYLWLNDNWRLRGYTIYDLGVEDTGLLKANLGLDYIAECYKISVTGERNLTDESSGESETSLTFRIGLKNLSDFDF